jgi:hypothetical protein
MSSAMRVPAWLDHRRLQSSTRGAGGRASREEEVGMSDTTPETDGRLRYRVLTGPDDRSFCERVSQALAEGYHLHGGPALTFDGSRVVVAQAVVLFEPPAAAAGEV